MKSRRSPEQVKLLFKNIVKYYFNNTGNNGYDTIAAKFNCNKSQIKKALSDELDKRFKKRHQECIKE